ncbi:MAG TPA: DUF4147 domain-containing protein [Thermoplasmata archaeon]|nr:DUF4147 domain-containing protein [Thermoplasmata archaeon]
MTLATDAVRFAKAGIRSVDPERAVAARLAREGRTMTVGPARFRFDGAPRVHLVAFGKAAGAMAAGARHRLGRWIVGGFAVVRDRSRPRVPGLREWIGEHPLPGPGSFRAGAEAMAYVRSIPPRDVVLFLASGGASSLLEVPDGDLSASDVRRTYGQLLACGAPIGAMNTVRRHLSRLKGGGLARASSSRRLATIAISDVIGDRPEDIASGPTVDDPTTFADALRVLERFGPEGRWPTAVVAHLRRGAASERRAGFSPRRLGAHPFVLAGSTALAVAGAATAARRAGYRTLVLSSRFTGPTADLGRWHAELLAGFARDRTPGDPPLAVVSGGESTVTLGPRPGRGGRNQEFALAAIETLGGIPSVALLSIGTDGIDGPTDAAGGVVTGTTAGSARRRGVDVARALSEHSAHDALGRLGALVRTGPTGTNVSDLHVGLVGRRLVRYGRK